jgi:MFS transporter, putative metabolite:H+ symporter
VSDADAFTPYQKRLFLFLSVATFFEGYDFLALTQILPNLRADLHLGKADAGYLVAFINVGTVVAYLLVRRADRWGRKRVLTATIAGYTLATFLTGLSPNVYAFALMQMLGRIFLIAEWATSNVIAAEEYPAARRGMVIGVISAFSTLGSVTCAGVVPLLLHTRYGWRSVYFVGILPLVALAIARRSLRETRRFSEQVGARVEKKRSLMHIFKTPHKRRVVELGLIWLATYVCTQNGVTFFKEFAVGERGMTDADVGRAIAIAAVVSMPLVFYVGRFLDVVGRRIGAVIIFGLSSAGVFFCYTLHGYTAITVALVFGIFGASAVLPVLNAYTAELFPTDLRGDAFAWSNNLIGRIGYVLSPAVVGYAAGQVGWGAAVRVTAIFPLIAVALIVWLLPETKSRELEETAAL